MGLNILLNEVLENATEYILFMSTFKECNETFRGEMERLRGYAGSTTLVAYDMKYRHFALASS